MKLCPAALASDRRTFVIRMGSAFPVPRNLASAFSFADKAAVHTSTSVAIAPCARSESRKFHNRAPHDARCSPGSYQTLRRVTPNLASRRAGPRCRRRACRRTRIAQITDSSSWVVSRHCWSAASCFHLLLFTAVGRSKAREDLAAWLWTASTIRFQCGARKAGRVKPRCA